jgi:hypothetical protein
MGLTFGRAESVAVRLGAASSSPASRSMSPQRRPSSSPRRMPVVAAGSQTAKGRVVDDRGQERPGLLR